MGLLRGRKLWNTRRDHVLQEMTVVVPFPALNDVDVQWLELERQRRLVREQTALINNNQTRESKDDDIQTK